MRRTKCAGCSGVATTMRSSSRITHPTKPKTLVSFARQAEAEGRPLILHALGHEVATLGPREIPGDGEPQANASSFAAGAGGLGPVEAVEEAGGGVWGGARARVR